MGLLPCGGCSQTFQKNDFSRAQLKKGAARRCESCIKAPQPSPTLVTEAEGEESSKAMLPFTSAATVIDGVESGSGMRTVLYALPIPDRLRPTVTALVSGALLEKETLASALADVAGPWQQPSQQQPSPHSLGLVLLQEMVARGRRVKGSARHPIARAVWERRADLEAALRRVGTGSEQRALSRPQPRSALPRYVRVNPLQGGTVPESIDALQSGTSKVAASEDPLVPGLLRLPPRANLHGHPLVRSGALIPQDRASCLPAVALSPPPGARVIDSCAAPGNKTTQLAALVGARGKVYAFERNEARAATLRAQVGRAGAGDIVSVAQADFLKTSLVGGPGGDATWALCDPSCSGSGGAGGHLGPEGAGDEYWERVEKLAQAQVAIVCKAMSFPKMETVVYSTCSIHQQENEDVVRAILDAQRGAWQLVPCLPAWPSRGLADVAEGALCVRASEADETHGFFVARFEKVGTGGSAAEAAAEGSKRDGAAAKGGAKGGAKDGSVPGAKKLKHGGTKHGGTKHEGTQHEGRKEGPGLKRKRPTEVTSGGAKAAAAAPDTAVTPVAARTVSTTSGKQRTPQQIARRQAKKKRQ